MAMGWKDSRKEAKAYLTELKLDYARLLVEMENLKLRLASLSDEIDKVEEYLEDA